MRGLGEAVDGSVEAVGRSWNFEEVTWSVGLLMTLC